MDNKLEGKLRRVTQELAIAYFIVQVSDTDGLKLLNKYLVYKKPT